MMSEMTTNFAYFGTPQLAADILESLKAAGYKPSVIVTVPDKMQGRGMDMRETPVARWARSENITVLKPEKLDTDFIAQLSEHECAFAIVVAYGKILPQAMLDVMPMYNIHYSLLPRWRGATPVESPILAGDTETGVTLQKIVYELDAGPIVAMVKTPIGPDETGSALRARLNDVAKKMLVREFPSFSSGSPTLVEQAISAVTHCGKIAKEDGLLDLAEEGERNYRKYRAYFGWPGTYAYFERSGKRIRTIIVKAHLEKKKFVIDTVKPEGKGEMPYADFLRSGAKPVSP